MTGSKMGQMALVYARKKGWAVFPLRERDKLPATANGFKDASSDPDTIAAMWGEREYNIGLATGAVSGVWVFDVDGDPPKGGGLTGPERSSKSATGRSRRRSTSAPGTALTITSSCRSERSATVPA